MTDYFDNWYFATNKTSNTCPTIPFKCVGPNACARDPNTGRSYCCDAGPTAVCWTGSTPCQGDGSTMACGSGTSSWCCLANGREKCTETRNQINICWSTAHDTLRNISVASLEAVQSSLASKNPDASSLMFTPTDIIAATRTPTATPSTSVTTTSSGASSATSSTSTSPAATSAAGAAEGAGSGNSNADSSSSSSSSLGPGAIAGVVVGLVAALAIIGLVGFLIWRRIKRKEADNMAAANAQSPGTSELSAQNGSPFSPRSNASELPIGYSHADKTHYAADSNREYYNYKVPATSPSEMPTPYTDATPAEMPTSYNTMSELPAQHYHSGGDHEQTPFNQNTRR
ncbi:hypothetical protein MCOR27_003999 [Pyricularia oryzae]|uniref:Uncharacterized protein n=1 Tax=Pyricularia oryzae TaxID=318829 RepID=A0A4P7MZ07_PYROR|nr:hypothetical protein MCOR01_011377 [Pyricularia oryzae]KAH9437526.1 hypothetical protein MCOR02_001183 [Pyricularia oryzae]KAI6266152.1 hypothetical protein MCOR26_010353 [Pyricularia oryzae]KAI6281899.1 hypothetical protein MCOR27_003999 [Pyricularia oryzae]KAI6314956.1 hypothetical protein MCOR30_009809 [Pyricularia oryzae]